MRLSRGMNEVLAVNWPCSLLPLASGRSLGLPLQMASAADGLVRGFVQPTLRLGLLLAALDRDAALALVPDVLKVVQSTASRQTRKASQTNAARSGDAATEFHRLIVPQLDAAYSFARFLVRDADAAQDIAQEAFLRAYRGFHGYRGGAPRAWLFTIVRHCFHDWQLERRHRQRFETDLDGGARDDEDGGSEADRTSDDATPETVLIRTSESEAVRSVLYGLPRPLREMLVLRELEDLSYREIADVTALPIGTVMSRLARARRAMSEAWQARAKGDEP